MALFEQQTLGVRATRQRAHCRSRRSGRTLSRRSTRTLRRSTTTPMGRRCILAASKRSRRCAIRPGKHVLEVGVGTGINLALYPRSQPRHRHRPVEQDAREGAEAHRREGPASLRRRRDGRDQAEVRGQLVRRRLCAVRDQRGARPGRGGARDVSRLPSRRPRRHPQSLQERERADGEDRNGDLADDGAHRLHGRPRLCRRS